jgi:hypothetical protein
MLCFLKSYNKKAWDYASEMGRHVREGRGPWFADAEFVVGFSALCCCYVVSKIGENNYNG